MTVYMFDTLKVVEKLQSSGFDERQAKGVVEILKEQREEELSQLVTKQDLTIEFAQFKTELIKEINDVMKWVVGAIVAMTGIFAAIVKLF